MATTLRSALNNITGRSEGKARPKEAKAEPAVLGGKNRQNEAAMKEAGMKKGGEVRGYGAARKPMKKGGACR